MPLNANLGANLFGKRFRESNVRDDKDERRPKVEYSEQPRSEGRYSPYTPFKEGYEDMKPASPRRFSESQDGEEEDMMEATERELEAAGLEG